MPSSIGKSPPESFDIKLLATIRCALATAGAIIFTLDLLTHTRLPEVSHFVLVLYFTSSVLLYIVMCWRRPILPGGVEPWLDVGSAILFACVGTILSFVRPEFELRHVFVGLTALAVLGYMTTAFGGRELIVKGRLAFMKEVTPLSNPRFRADRTIATGIPVQIEASEDLRLNDQLVAEVFQMVPEGLSNVLRHTRATWAFITLAQCNDDCTLQIANDGAAPALFTPCSLMERASALGGRMR